MNEIVADKSDGHASQISLTGSPRWMLARPVSGTKNRTKTLSGGSSDMTGAPAATVSPGRAFRDLAPQLVWQCHKPCGKSDEIGRGQISQPMGLSGEHWNVEPEKRDSGPGFVAQPRSCSAIYGHVGPRLCGCRHNFCGNPPTVSQLRPDGSTLGQPVDRRFRRVPER